MFRATPRRSCVASKITTAVSLWPRTVRSFWVAIGMCTALWWGAEAPTNKLEVSAGYHYHIPRNRPGPVDVCKLQSGNHPWHGRAVLVVGGVRSQSGCSPWHTCSPLPVPSRALAGTGRREPWFRIS
ncbi:hypothetical protein F5883DRAFT_576392 [Diaporthe sp. PMI_573]|nr:hypothetical protein F5883DRAFT_576392 [Diaporthaceae sp. PMI_573]